MGIFGGQDAADVSENPFFVAAGVYQCLLTEIALRQGKTDNYGLSFQWQVDDDESSYNKSNVSEWINIYFDDDDNEVDETRKRRDRARLKQRLMDVGFSEEEMDRLVEFDNDENKYVLTDLADTVVGYSAFVEVTNTPDKTDPSIIYTNIKKITALDSVS